MLRVLLAGQKWFGAETFRTLRSLGGVDIVAVSSPVGGEKVDRLTAQATLYDVPVIPSGTLNASTVPEGIDLIVAAHSHDFIGEKTRFRALYGGIGYHPSLLPLHRGRDAVRWTCIMGDRVSGGTVYRLSNRMDGGNILAQDYVVIEKNADYRSLWRERLAPMGVRLISDVVARFRDEGFIPGEPQDESLATWEPSIDRPPAFRPDLVSIEAKNAGSTAYKRSIPKE